MPQIYCNKHHRSDMDSCQLCEDESPVWERTLLLHLDVPTAWLDPDACGRPLSVSQAWEELRLDITDAFAKLYNKYQTQFIVPTLVDSEWDAEPEVKK